MAAWQWRTATPREARRWLAGTAAPWWIAGGQALDVWLGSATRAHSDLDLGCFREDLGRLRRALGDWELHAARDGCLRRLAGDEAPTDGEHVVWCRPSGDDGPWLLELLLEDRRGGEWIFRRDSSIRLPADRLVLSTREGLPILRPEVQLLYKAKDPRPQDEEDFARSLPALERPARVWLRDALARVHPGHSWIARIEHVLAAG